MIQRLETQLHFVPDRIAKMQDPVACVEAGHIYTDEIPSRRHEIGAIVGKNVSSVLEGMGIRVQRMLFVDDYNAQSQDLDISGYKSSISRHGFVPDQLIFESSLTKEAEKVIAALEEQNLTQADRNGTIILKKDRKGEQTVVLRKSPKKGATPACAALDAALYLKKSAQADMCVTVLHSEWKDQQDKVKKVLKALGKDNTPILEVYYTDDGEIEVDFDY